MTRTLEDVVKEVATGLARDGEMRKFVQLADGTIVYVSRSGPDATLFDVVTIGGVKAQCDFLKTLHQQSSLKDLPPPYSELEVSRFEQEGGVAIPDLLRCYLTEVSSSFPVVSDDGKDVDAWVVPLKVDTCVVVCADDERDETRDETTRSVLVLTPLSAAILSGPSVGGVLKQRPSGPEDAEAIIVPLWQELYAPFMHV